MIEWTPDLAVGIDEIDAQHQELYRRAERFITGLSESNRQDVGILLSYLRLYCVTHFGAEEAWMRDIGYPGYDQHKAEHDGFVEHLLQLSAEHERRGAPGLQPMRVGSWLSRWLETHVSGTDKAFAQFVLARSA
ncbi:MAG: bacteriohemerythrin [Anaeromyxobacter sp.]